ncbi:MAG: TIGR01620 family protein [Alphaproteobacteria bacterium]
MKQREQIRPFELDPATLKPDDLEILQPEPDGSLPAPLAPAEVTGARKRPWLKLFLSGAAAFALGVVGLDAYDYTLGLFERSVWLGGVFSTLLALAAIGAFGWVGREVWSLRRLAKVDDLRTEGERLMASEAHGQAEDLLRKVEKLYRERTELDRPIWRFHDQASDALNDRERLELFAHTVFQPIDKQAYQIVKRSGRDIGVLTALTPIGALDSLIVLVRTVAMMRAIARLYGVRPGLAATISLAKRGVRNIVIAGVGDLVSHAAVETAGASLLKILSARAGQGAINGLLAARIGLSVMQICRPIPFAQDELPSLKKLRAEIFKELADGREAADKIG